MPSELGMQAERGGQTRHLDSGLRLFMLKSLGLSVLLKAGVEAVCVSNVVQEPLRSEAQVRESGPERQARILELHLAGTCRPCSFRNAMNDGCRMGDMCSYCHWCTPEEARRRKNRLCWDRKREANRQAKAMQWPPVVGSA